MDALLDMPDGTRLMLLAPLVRGRKGEYRNVFEEMRKAGYVRVRVDGEMRDLSEEIELDKYKIHTHRGGGGPAGDPPRGDAASRQRRSS